MIGEIDSVKLAMAIPMIQGTIIEAHGQREDRRSVRCKYLFLIFRTKGTDSTKREFVDRGHDICSQMIYVELK